MINKKLEPMMEIFLEECEALLQELGEVIFETEKQEEFTREDINTIFRVMHTIKANATMMLIENIAELARTLEKLLYFLRDKNKLKINTIKLRNMLEECLEFLERELYKLESGYEPNGDGEPLQTMILNYLELITNNQEVENYIAFADEEEQIYYIGSIDADEINEERKYCLATVMYVDNEKICEKSIMLANTIRVIYDAECKHFPSDFQSDSVKELIEQNGFVLIFATEVECQDIYDVLIDSIPNDILNLESINYVDDMIDLVRHYKLKFEFEHDKINKEKGNDYMVKFDKMFSQMKMVVQEMNKNLNRNVILDVIGEDVQIEKSKYEKLANALVHMIRNAVDHGIGTKEDRLKSGKDGDGRISLEVLNDDDQLFITVSDDGVGIEQNQIREKAIEKGLIPKEYIPSEKEIYKLILQPGFTTRNIASDYSGRGVGLDVVNNNINKIGGTLEISSEEGVGTRMNIIIPMNHK